MTPFEKAVDTLIREWHRQAAEQHAVARRLHGVERYAATTHANVKDADADALRRLCWTHGVGIDPATEKKPGAKR